MHASQTSLGSSYKMTSLLIGAPTATSANLFGHNLTLLQRSTITDRDLIAVLNRCASLRSGKEVHAFLLRNPISTTCHLLTSLIKFYSKHGSLSQARQVFDQMPERDVVSWTTILMAYNECDGCTEEMMRLLNLMVCSGIAPNRHTVTVVLQRATVEQGKQLHGHVIKNGWDSDEFIGSCLIDFYAKNWILGDARLVFDLIGQRDVVCYNTLLSNYSRMGLIDGLVLTFNEMGWANLVPDESTLVALLNGCANFGLLNYSKQFHAQSIVRGFSSNEIIQGIIVDMYSKCGDLQASCKAFDLMLPTKSIVAWNSMIGGYGKHGCIGEALRVFDSMRLASVLPDHITFTLLLSASSHLGLVSEGWKLFTLMKEVYRIPARNEHYCCMVDLLGRAGMVKDAYDFLGRSGHDDLGASVWTALLASCRVWGDVEIGEVAARKLFEIEPDNSGPYVALAAIFAECGRWNDAVKVRGLMEGNGVRKDAGYSRIEVGGLVREFKAGKGVECSSEEEVYSFCDRLNKSIQDFPQVDESVGYCIPTRV